jgi:hypothetical protein
VIEAKMPPRCAAGYQKRKGSPCLVQFLWQALLAARIAVSPSDPLPIRRTAMNTRMLTVAAIATLLLSALPCSAQLTDLPPLEPVKPPKEGSPPEPIKPPKEVLPLPIVEEHCPTGIRVLWAETDVPLCSLWPREVITMVKQPTFVVAYREEKIKVADIVVKPHVVKKAQLCTCEKEVQVTDPVTGVCSTVKQPVTEERIIEETEYSAVRVERDEVVRIPYLKKVDELVPRKDLLLEYRTEMVTKGHPVPIPDDVPCSRVFCVPDLCELPPLPCLGEKGCPAPQK